MTLSNRLDVEQATSRVRSTRSRSRSPLRGRRSDTAPRTHLDETERRLSPNHWQSQRKTRSTPQTAQGLLHLVRSFFSDSPRSRLRRRDDQKDSDMDCGPTVVESIPHYRLHPSMYDGIRPAQSQRRTEVKHHGGRQSSSKGTVIPIHVEHISHDKSSGTKKNAGTKKSTPASPIEVGDIIIDLMEPSRADNSKGNSHSKKYLSKTGRSESPIVIDGVADNRQRTFTDRTTRQSMAGERLSTKRHESAVDLTETPRVKDEILPKRVHTATAHTEGKWTIIPIHHIKKGPSKDPEKLPATTKKAHENEKDVHMKSVFKQSNHEEKTIQNTSSVQGNHIVPSHEDKTFSRRCETSTKDSVIDLLPPADSDKSTVTGFQDASALLNGLATSDSLLMEQDVNPSPSYPIYEVLKKQLSKENREIDYIKGDGNCFFRALSKQIHGTEKFHKDLRNLTVDIMATNRSFFVQFIDGGDVQGHVDRMSEENTWATTCEIYAAATLFQRDIYMLTPNHNNTLYSWLLFRPLFTKDFKPAGKDIDCASRAAKDASSLFNHSKSDDPCCLTLCNTNGNHYDRVVPDHGGCNCFLPVPHLDGQSGSVDLT